MKLSRYNHYMENENYSYWYNPLYNQFFRLPLALGQKLNQHLTSKQDLSHISETLHSKFVESHFLVDEEMDELELVRSNYKAAINSKNAFLIIMPTLNCNYSCWYCIQKHIVSIMSEDTKDAILRHVKYLIDVERIESLHIDWFGGEPFMFYRQVVKPISKAVMKMCDEAGIPFMNSATTNAYFLAEDVTRDLEDLRFSMFQITLDGDREHHDKVKFMKGLDSAFDLALININRILDESEHTRILLRINYTHSNISERIVDEVCDLISVENRNRVIIMPKKVWQEKVDKEFENVLEPIIRKFSDSGFWVEFWAPIQNFMPCYASSKYYKAINYNGHVLKCTANDDLYRTDPLGVIAESGEVIWKAGFEEKSCESGFENEKCLSCKKLPSCMGLCPRNHQSHSGGCSYNAADATYETSVMAFVDEQYRRTRENQHK